MMEKGAAVITTTDLEHIRALLLAGRVADAVQAIDDILAEVEAEREREYAERLVDVLRGLV